jgi:hypothetical protein
MPAAHGGNVVAHKNKDKALAAPKATWTDAELGRLADQAQHGDEDAMQELRQAFAREPALVARFTDVAMLARITRARVTFGDDNLLAHDLLERKVAAMRQELAGPHPTVLERLLAEQVATCWAAAHLADLDVLKAGQALDRAEYFDRRHYRAHKRYLDAIVALARVRRLLSPSVTQVNIAQPGGQQLNVATPGPAPATPPAAGEALATSLGSPGDAQ